MVLVTGGTGFLGQHLVRVLQSRGVDVRVLARSRGSNPTVDWHVGSVLDSASLESAMSGCDAVFHLAGRVDRDRRQRAALRTLHVEGTRQVCEMALTMNVSRLIYASTSGIVGVSRQLDSSIHEDSHNQAEIVADWPYYATKLEAEELAMSYGDRHKLPLVVINPSLLLGPGDSRGSSTSDVADVLAGRVPALAPGSLNFVDVRDVAETTADLLTKGTVGERYLLGGANWSLSRFIREVAALGNVKAPRLMSPPRLTRIVARASARVSHFFGVPTPLDPVSVEMSQVHWCFSSDKAKQELGFSPRDPWDTLKDTIVDLNARRGKVTGQL